MRMHPQKTVVSAAVALTVLAPAFVVASSTVAASDAASAEVEGSAPDAGTSGDAGGASREHDPIERFNRGVFWLNDTLDVYALEPVARGWDSITPDAVQRSLANFFRNLRFPIVLVNNLLQGKVHASATTLARFMVNTTFGVAGFLDLAGKWGLEPRPEDFGQTLGWWGTPPGPYLVLPLFGPSSVRDTGGLAIDFLGTFPVAVNQWIIFGAGAVNTINTRAQFLDQIKAAKESSLDYYVFVRNAYLQHRRAQVDDRSFDEGPALGNDIDSNLYYEDVWSEDAED